MVVCLSEFLSYWMPHEGETNYTVFFTRHQSTKQCQAFQKNLLANYITWTKVGVASNMGEVLRKCLPCRKCFKYQNFLTLFACQDLWKISVISDENLSKLLPPWSHSKPKYSKKLKCTILAQTKRRERDVVTSLKCKPMKKQYPVRS